MKKQPATVNAGMEKDWLEKAKALFDAGELRNVTGLTLADTTAIEELLQYMADRRPKSRRLPDDYVFSLDLAPRGLAEE